jgi:hypothetical protein
MAERRWPTLRELLDREDDVLDDTITHVRPSPEERAARRAEADALLAELRANGQDMLQPDAPRRRGSAHRRTSA